MSQGEELYKGYEINPAPYKLRSGEWEINLFISIERGNERIEKQFGAANTYETREKAISHCIDFGKRIIDGEIKDLTVEDI